MICQSTVWAFANIIPVISAGQNLQSFSVSAILGNESVPAIQGNEGAPAIQSNEGAPTTITQGKLKRTRGSTSEEQKKEKLAKMAKEELNKKLGIESSASYEGALKNLIAKCLENANDTTKNSGVFLSFVKYLEGLYDDGCIYNLARLGEDDRCIDAIFKSPVQESVFSVLYNMPFADIQELCRFEAEITSSFEPLLGDCKSILCAFKTLHAKMCAQILETVDSNVIEDLAQASLLSGPHKTAKKLLRRGKRRADAEQMEGEPDAQLAGASKLRIFEHRRFYKEYRGYFGGDVVKHDGYRTQGCSEMQNAPSTSDLNSYGCGTIGTLERFLTELHQSINKKNDVNIRVVAQEYFNTILLKTFRAGAMTEALLMAAIYPYRKARISIANFQILPYLFDYRPSHEDAQKQIDEAVENFLANRRSIMNASIYDLFRIYRYGHRMDLHMLSNFIISVSARIQQIDGDNRAIFNRLHHHLILRVLTGYDKSRFPSDSIACFHRISAECEPLRELMSVAVITYAMVVLSDPSPCARILRVISDLYTAGQVNTAECLLLEINKILCAEQPIANRNQLVPGLFRSIAGIENIVHKIFALYELVNCGLLNTMILLDPAVLAQFTEEIGQDEGLTVDYSLAYLLYIGKALGGSVPHPSAPQLIQTYRDLKAKYGPILNSEAYKTYSTLSRVDSRVYPKGEYYLLYACDDLLKTRLNVPADRVESFTFKHHLLLWKNLEFLDSALVFSPCGSELRMIKLLLFQNMRLYYNCASDSALAFENVLVFSRAKMPFTEIYTAFFRQNPAYYKDRVLLMNLVQYCVDRFDGNDAKFYYDKSIPSEHGKLKRFFDEKMAKLEESGCTIGDLTAYIRDISAKLFSWGWDRVLADEALNKLLCNLASRIGDLCLELGGMPAMPTGTRELKVIAAFDHVLRSL